jgi:hypothetical protein
MKRIPDQGITGATALREAAAGEFRQIIELVRAALVTKLAVPPERNWMIDIEAIFADRVIMRREGRFWSYGYSLGEDNQVTLTESTEVVESYVPVRMTEAAGDFLEAADAEGTVWDANLIRAGLSLNKNFYPDAVLREAAPLFEGRPIFAKSDDKHLKGEGKDVNNIIGWISAPRFIEGKAMDTGRITGRVNLSAASNLRAVLADAWKRGKKDLAGLSIDCEGTAKTEMRESKKVRVAKSITKVNSVDLIVEPGAGGALVRMVEAADPDLQHNNVEKSDMKLKERMLEAIKAKKPELYAKINPETITDEELEARYAEAVTPEPVIQANAATPEQVAEQVRMVEARANMRIAVAGSKLPPAAQDKLLAQFTVMARFTEADVGAAIKAERQYVARFTESGKVVLDDKGDIVVEDRSVKMAEMLDAFFDPAHKNHRATQSFKECYIEITGDRRVTGRMKDMDRVRLAESVGTAFRESLDASSLTYTLGDAVTRRLLADYRVEDQYSVWRPLVNVVPINDFRTQHRTRFGGYAELATIAQSAPYSALASPGDEEATYYVQKRGGTEDITLEMMKNDDVGAIRQIPIKISRAAKRTLAIFVLDFIRSNPTLYDSVAFFHATHANLGANALDATYLAAARLRMLKQAEAGSSARLGIPPKNLIVPVDLQETAVNLFNRNTNNDKTFVNAMTLNIIPVWYWTDTNDWAIGADPMDIPSIEVGFLDGNEEPEIFVQDMPNVGSMFTNDKITYKVRHVYGGQVVNFRGYDKSVV